MSVKVRRIEKLKDWIVKNPGKQAKHCPMVVDGMVSDSTYSKYKRLIDNELERHPEGERINMFEKPVEIRVIKTLDARVIKTSSMDDVSKCLNALGIKHSFTALNSSKDECVVAFE